MLSPTGDNKDANLFHKLYINVVHLLGVFLGCANIRSSLHKVPFSNLIPFLSHLSPISLKISHLSLLSKGDCHGPAQCSQLPLKGPTINNLCH